MKKIITPSTLLDLDKRYGDTNWAHKDPERIGNLVRRMSLLDTNEKDLIIKLTDQVCYIDYLDIPPFFNTAFKQFLDSSHQCDHIIIAPLKSPFLRRLEEDTVGRILTQKTKSSDFCYTTFKNTFIKAKYAENLHFCFCDTPQDIKKNFKNACKIALIDDFIGSGETAVKYINEYILYLECEGIKVSKSQFSIVVIIAMEEGKEYINSEINVDTFFSILKQKGIRGNSLLNTANNIGMMKSIESKVLHKLNPAYSFGYKASESLVSIMEKSPNNTFPFYWYKGKKEQNKNLKPIFRRNI